MSDSPQAVSKGPNLGQNAAPRASPLSVPNLMRAAIAIPILVLGAAVFVTPGFLTVDNITAIFRNAAIVGIVAVAMTPVTLSGNFVSLGIGQSAMLAMVSFVVLIGAGWPEAAAIFAVIALLVVVGVVQSVIIAVGLNPIITTLAAGAIIFGTVSELTNGGIVRSGANAVGWGTSTFAGVPIQVVVFVLFTLVVWLIMAKTVIGRHTILVGANRATAEISGISHARVAIAAFGIFSVGLAIAGILNGAAFGQATANSFPDLTIQAIAALLVGGTAIQGGRGSPFRSAAGAVIIAIIANMMVLNDFSTGGRLAVQGAVVAVIVVLIEVMRRRQGGQG